MRDSQTSPSGQTSVPLAAAGQTGARGDATARTTRRTADILPPSTEQSATPTTTPNAYQPAQTQQPMQVAARADARTSNDPHVKHNRTRPGGPYRFDRNFQSIGLGRLQFSSGTTDAEEFRYRNSILTRLVQRSQYDTVRAIRDGTLSWEQITEADRTGRLQVVLSDIRNEQRRRRDTPWLADIGDIESLRLWRRPHDPRDANIPSVLDTVLPNIRVGKSARSKQTTQRRYLTSLRALRDHETRFFGPLATVGTLLDMSQKDWDALHDGWERSESDWNHLRSVISRVLTVLFGHEAHPARVRVMEFIPKDTVPERIVDVSPDLFNELLEAMPLHLQSAPLAIVLTGMRISEYLRTTRSDLYPDIRVVHVPGKKTQDADGTVAIAPELWRVIDAAVPCPVSYRTLWGYWWDARVLVGGRHGMPAGEPLDVRLHDLRHLHGQWAIDGGARLEEVKTSLRHASIAMTMRYVRRAEQRSVATGLATTLAPRR